MKYTKLGKTDFNVSVIAFGGWSIVSGFNWGFQDKNDSINALTAAYDKGINFFDTAELYGNGESEKLISEALKHVRGKIIIATKVTNNHYRHEDLIKSCEASLKALRTDYIDIYQLHWPSCDISDSSIIETLEYLKKSGKIREYGVSNFGVNNLKSILNYTDSICCNQLCFNLLFRAIEFEVLPLCIKYKIPVLCYSPLMQGILTGKFISADKVPPERARTRHFSCLRKEVTHSEEGAEELTFETIMKIKSLAEDLGMSMENISLGWLLNKKGVASVIIGGRNSTQVEKNIYAADIILSEDILRELDKITEPLKHKLGSNPDVWQNNYRIN